MEPLGDADLRRLLDAARAALDTTHLVPTPG